jgi:hypothetical protein
MLPVDIIAYLCEFLDDRSKIRWLSACKQHRGLIGKINIRMVVKYTKVAHLPYINIFTNMIFAARGRLQTHLRY